MCLNYSIYNHCGEKVLNGKKLCILSQQWDAVVDIDEQFNEVNTFVFCRNRLPMKNWKPTSPNQMHVLFLFSFLTHCAAFIESPNNFIFLPIGNRKKIYGSYSFITQILISQLWNDTCNKCDKYLMSLLFVILWDWCQWENCVVSRICMSYREFICRMENLYIV